MLLFSAFNCSPDSPTFCRINQWDLILLVTYEWFDSVSNVLCFLAIISANWNWANWVPLEYPGCPSMNLDGWPPQRICLSLIKFHSYNWDSSVKWESAVIYAVVMLCAVPHAALLVFPKLCFSNKRIQWILRRYPFPYCVRWPHQDLQRIFPKYYVSKICHGNCQYVPEMCRVLQWLLVGMNPQTACSNFSFHLVSEMIHIKKTSRAECYYLLVWCFILPQAWVTSMEDFGWIEMILQAVHQGITNATVEISENFRQSK